jgi:hypothetical protein
MLPAAPVSSNLNPEHLVYMIILLRLSFSFFLLVLEDYVAGTEF